MALLSLILVLSQAVLLLQARQISRDPCSNFQCLNGGKCTAPTDYPYCICPTGFSGKYCETKDGSLTDPCGGCALGQVCRATGIVCIKAPCPTHKCVDMADPCGGCPPGQTCKSEYIPCPYPEKCIKWRKQHPNSDCPYWPCPPIHICQPTNL